MRYFKFIILALLATSCDDIIEVQDISDETVNILAPIDGSSLTFTDINFSWNAVEDAGQYKLQIATPDFEMATQIVLDTTITATSFTQNLDLANYEWRVRAENSDYQTSYTTQSFSVEE